jgi:hypothetical protein
MLMVVLPRHCPTRDEAAMKTTFELSPDQLYCTVGPRTLDIHTAAQRTPIEGIIGQPRAASALRFELGIHKTGSTSTWPAARHRQDDRSTDVSRAARQREGTPPDWCYVHNFAGPYQPQVYHLPAGRGRKLQQALQQVISEVRRELPKAPDASVNGRVDRRPREFTAIVSETQQRNGTEHVLIH